MKLSGPRPAVLEIKNCSFMVFELKYLCIISTILSRNYGVAALFNRLR